MSVESLAKVRVAVIEGEAEVEHDKEVMNELEAASY
jgi:hypothetical protein